MSWITAGSAQYSILSCPLNRAVTMLMLPFRAVASSQQHTQVLSSVSEMERGASEPPVYRSAAPSTSTAPMSIPRSSSISYHPHPGSKKHRRTPLYQRSVSGHVQWCAHWRNGPLTWCCRAISSNCMDWSLLESEKAQGLIFMETKKLVAEGERVWALHDTFETCDKWVHRCFESACHLETNPRGPQQIVLPSIWKRVLKMVVIPAVDDGQLASEGDNLALASHPPHTPEVCCFCMFWSVFVYFWGWHQTLHKYGRIL